MKLIIYVLKFKIMKIKRKDFEKEIFGITELFVVISKFGKFVGGILNYDNKKDFLVGDLYLNDENNLFIVGKNKEELKENSIKILEIRDKIHKLPHNYDFYLHKKINFN